MVKNDDDKMTYFIDIRIMIKFLHHSLSYS